ncbi:hypothetical protein CDQ84_09045 [Clostridium thermosuccinogenes]|uniref:Uncharacterized protein n=1 Tax=Clostridium thermosuccinogenes TaxID=84032 RepID=A0A2K2EVU8_9CLOT|nr:hypothetical protein [Pseudoclostridium thermosuccinogenes]AUS95290.1 hypothetical protein CDO33_01815 [Pseudoclostridium thermosuccinogenes]PNT90648.1 hypothetical protein CDQ83_18605 [Pseudoclostridium thermosuccinogenes]PNT97255.1 hypothetical protein CDQ85_08895 [Pseudoclostridium thermosuccinogenes]PNT99232.1 hypothetical protein CDQ84_09045 [Pseudoclostridium thermosuccinogenes]
MKNNFKALLLHLIIVILSFIFLIIFVATGPVIAKYASNIISRIIIGVPFLLVYIFSGTLLDRNISKKFDFLAGSFIGVIGIALWFFAFLKTKVNLFEIIPEELIDHWVLVNIYYTPFLLSKLSFGLPNIPVLSLIINLLPTLLMGLGLKYKRLKYKID